MKKIKKGGILLATICLLMGCSEEYNHKGKTPLVEVSKQFLYKEDLQSVLPLNLSQNDSLLFVAHYIQNWIEDVLFFEKAKGNVAGNEKIERLVENYRRALIMHTYQEELINQKLANQITAAEIEAYYVKNSLLFQLEEPYVKGLFIKVPLGSPDLSAVRKLYKRNDPDAVEQLEKYSLRNAVSYDYFYDHWLPASGWSNKIPLKAIELDLGYLEKNRDVETKDSAFHYFLHIENYLGKGMQKPIDLVEGEIKEILLNMKRVEFINQIKDELYQRALDKNEISYYYLNSNE
ncbi:MAG: peptidyl-prolyl cis-trans isomerase [Phocaeicola sp.]